MGLLDKIKQTFNIGGISLEVKAPATCIASEPIPVTVTLLAKSTQQVKTVKVQLLRLATKQFDTSDRDLQQMATLTEVQNMEPFVMNAGETKSLPFELRLDTNLTSPKGEGIARLARSID